jgi:hypothetical protein
MPENRLPWSILECEPEETGREDLKKEDGVRRRTTNHGLTEEDARDIHVEKLSFG